MKLRQFELSEVDWETAIDLCDMLKVWLLGIQPFALTSHFIRCLRMQPFIFYRGTPNLL